MVWKPRWVLRVAVAAPVEAVEAKEAADHVVKEMVDLRTAMMRVLNRFPDAAKAVMEMFLEITRRRDAPEWAHEGG